ncbi:MAG: PorT family protein [Paramuribaculum sp.]|nr:PorT family protein [Paramuribaculum sp.]
MNTPRQITLLAILFMALTILRPEAKGVEFCNHGAPDKFLSLETQLMIGGSGITQNYGSSFPEIRDINASMGVGWGLGVVAEFGIRDYLWLGTQVNMIVNNNKLDVAVSNANATSISNIFLSNRAYYLNFPVYLSFKFNIAAPVRWNVDFGGYYSYGFAGSQKQTIYNSLVNELGGLINRTFTSKPSFFNNNSTFINRFCRGDIGVMVATGLTFAGHYHIGVRSTIGLKNISKSSGIVNPNIHNATIMVTLGYRF